jgi:hypothetical protein
MQVVAFMHVLVTVAAVGDDFDRIETVAGDGPDLNRAQGIDNPAQGIDGDVKHAQTLAHPADEAALAITDPHQRTLALSRLATTAAANGDVGRARKLAKLAEEAVRAITDPEKQAHAMTAFSQGSAAAGDFDRAEAAAMSITDLNRREQLLTALAIKAEPNRAITLIAHALMAADWTVALCVLARIQPAAILLISDEYMREAALQAEPRDGVGS